MPLGIKARGVVGVPVTPHLDVVLGPVAGVEIQTDDPHINEGVDIHPGGDVVVMLLIGQVVVAHILHHLVEVILVALHAGGQDEVGVGVGMHLAVIALDDGDVVLVHAVVTLHVLAGVALTDVVHTPELAVDEDQGGGGGHDVHVQACGGGLHESIADVGGSAVVTRVTDHDAGEGGDGLTPLILGGTAEDVVVQIRLQTAVLVVDTLEVDTEGLHAPARGAVAADRHFHAGVTDTVALRVKDLHDAHTSAAAAGDGAGQQEVVVEALGADDLVLGHRNGHDGHAVLGQVVGDEVGIGEDVGGLGAVGGVGLDDVAAHLSGHGGRGPGAGQRTPAHGGGIAEHDARGVLLTARIGGQSGIGAIGGVVDGVAVLGGEVQNEGLVVDARIVGEQHLVELGGNHLVDGAACRTGTEVPKLGGGGAGEVDGMVAAVLLHSGTEGDLITGEVVEGVDRGVVLHGGHEHRHGVVKGGHVLVSADAPARGGQQEADLLIVQIHVPLGVAMLHLHDGVIGVEVGGGVGAHQIVAARGDDGALGEYELVEGIVSVALVVERGTRQGDVLVRLVVELDVAVGDESLGALLTRTVDRVDQNTLIERAVTGVEGGIVGQGLFIVLGFGGGGLGLVSGDFNDGRLTHGLVRVGSILGIVGGIARIGGGVGGIARHGVTVGIGLGGGVHGGRGISRGIGAAGGIGAGGQKSHQKGQCQKYGHRPKAGSVVLQKFHHKRYLRFQECVAVYL